MTKPKSKSKLKSTTAAFKPVVAIEPKKNEPAGDDNDDEPELEEALDDRRGPADIDEPALGARAPPPPTQWMRQTDVAKHLRVSLMTIHRYLNDPKYTHLNFPKPTAVIVDRSYWDRADIDAWMRSRVGAVSSRKGKSKAVA